MFLRERLKGQANKGAGRMPWHWDCLLYTSLGSTSIPGFKASGRFKQKLEAGKAAKTEEAV